MPSEERGRLLTCPEWRKLCLGRQNNFLALPQSSQGVLLGLKLSKSKCHCGWPPAGHPAGHACSPWRELEASVRSC